MARHMRIKVAIQFRFEVRKVAGINTRRRLCCVYLPMVQCVSSHYYYSEVLKFLLALMISNAEPLRLQDMILVLQSTSMQMPMPTRPSFFIGSIIC